MSSWEEKILAESQFIKVNIEKIKISVDDSDVATTKFIQDYESNTLERKSNKLMKFKQYEGKWLIIQESLLE